MTWLDWTNFVLALTILFRMHTASVHRAEIARRRDAREEYFFRLMVELPLNRMERLIDTIEASEDPTPAAMATARQRDELREMVRDWISEAPVEPKDENKY